MHKAHFEKVITIIAFISAMFPRDHLSHIGTHFDLTQNDHQ